MSLSPHPSPPGSKPSKKSSSTSASSSLSFSVRLVFQRFRYCALLLNNSTWVSVGDPSEDHEVSAEGSSISTTAAVPAPRSNDDTIDDHDDNIHNVAGNHQDDHQQHCGLLVYVSFARDATMTSAVDAAQHIVNLPLLTTGLWGDGVSKTYSVLTNDNMGGNGDDDDDQGPDRSSTSSTTSSCSIVLVPQANLISKVKQKGKSIQYHGQASFHQGQELYDVLVQEVRRLVDEWEQERGGDEAGDDDADHRRRRRRSNEVVAGTFGTRQGLKIESDMGPFCHVINL